jgi:phosphodiesterase/alkaline phosphatase D-like protein
MLGPAQKSWFLQSLHDSPATWKLWANEVMMMGLQTSPGVGVNEDQWDGYAAERREIVDFIANNGISNVVSLVGDIHAFFTGSVDRDGGNASPKVMAEFVGGSVTSRGLPEETGIDAKVIENALKLNDKHVSFADLAHRGYAILEVTPTELTCEYKTVQVAVPDGGQASTLAKWSLPSGTAIPQRTA